MFQNDISIFLRSSWRVSNVSKDCLDALVVIEFFFFLNIADLINRKSYFYIRVLLHDWPRTVSQNFTSHELKVIGIHKSRCKNKAEI